MKARELNVEVLQVVLDKLRDPETFYNQGHFVMPCGTPACLAAKIVDAAPGWRFKRLKDTGGWAACRKGQCMSISLAASKIVDLTAGQATSMFRAMPPGVYLDEMRGAAIRLLEHLIDEGTQAAEVDWKAAVREHRMKEDE